MKEFDYLLEVLESLQAPNGCPWDKAQTFKSLRPYLLEETHELLEALDENNTQMIVEELGDLLFQILFIGLLGKKTTRFTLSEVISKLTEKLVYRHPHVFGKMKVEGVEEVLHNWERLKAEEKKERKHCLEGIPKTLGSLARAQKIIDKMIRKKINLPEKIEKASNEETVGRKLLDLIIQAQKKGVDAESALRRSLKSLEDLFKN